MTTIQLPYNFTPRPYQLNLLRALDSGIKRAICIWHRRSGKDKTLINLVAKKAFERRGVYYYFFPTYQQGRKVLWDGMDSTGFPLMDHFPPAIIKTRNDREMKLVLKNGSVFQVVGTDAPDAIRGTNPVGCVFSEYAFQDPAAWETVRPILLENGGWAVFNTTPNGKNHAYTLYEMAKNNPEWFAETLTAADTGVLSAAQIESERREGMDEEALQRDYFCSFKIAAAGAFYGKALDQATVANVAIEPSLPVDTWWDLGMSDSTAIIFTQNVGGEVRVIDYLEEAGEGLAYYVERLREKGYHYGRHNAPHDIKVRELGSGKSRIEVARSLGIDFRIVKNIPLMDGINAVRALLPRCFFDQKRCGRLLEALANYRREFDEQAKEYRSTPLHDWSSHGADAFRYLAVGHIEEKPTDKQILRENAVFSRRVFDSGGY